MNKTLFQSFLLSALILLNAPAYAYQYVEWSSLPTFRVLEWCTTSGETDADAPTDEYNSLMEQAEALASDDDAVAVGKLRKAIQWAKDNNDESQLQAAIDQFLADNADLVKDETARVGTKMADWNVGSGNNSQKATYSHNGITLIEHFGETRVGIMLSQEVSVENGTYNIELYATSHNAWNGQYMPVSADNPAPSLQADADDVAYVFGSSLGVAEQTWITARRNSGMSSFEPETYAINGVQVFDEKLLIGLALAKAGQTEWHTIQIKSLKWITTAKQAYAAAKSRLSSLVAEGLILFRDENKTNGKEVFTAYLKRAEETMYFSSNFNIPELEAVVAELKDAIADFRRANYYIDFAAGEYYILDGESRLMIAAGNEWGTHGIVNEQGLDLILTPNTTNRSVSINSRITNGGSQHYLGSTLFMDGDEYGWFFDSYGPAFYITNGQGGYLNIDVNNNLVLGNTPHEWIVVPKEELMQERMNALESASQNSPVDATFLLQNPTFNRNDMRSEAWVVSNCTDKTLGGPLYDKVENYCAESYHSTFTISQTISDAPAGIYQLAAQGFYRQEDGVAEDAPKFFIGDETAELPAIAGSENSMADAGASFYMGLYAIEPITFVYDGKGGLTVGIEGTATHQWVAFDNFQLSYLGEAETPQEHEYVDLGLPSGTLWATCNVGANSPEEYGDYFAWGETTPKEDFDNFESYRISDYILAKYNVDGGTGILISLQPEDDAATVNWGSDWQMPSEAQIEELLNEEYIMSEWTQLNGVNGRLITSKSNGNSIFLPAAGDCIYKKSGEGIDGSYWSRCMNVNYYSASAICFTSNMFAHYVVVPQACLSVRPVRYTEPVLVSSIVLSDTLLNMEVGTFRLLSATTIEPYNADNRYEVWKSSDPNIATISYGKVRAHSVGTCTITCYATDGSGVKAECQVTVYEPEEHDYVDLGLPSGTLWATCNVGAENPEDYGDYFAWGETTPKNKYNWNTYKYCEGSLETMTKYCDISEYGYNGFTDNLKELLPQDDAATANWGSGWQMPDIGQIEELINSDYTTTEWTIVNGVNGRKITSKINGNSIFLPAAGWRYDMIISDVGSQGVYWSRSLLSSFLPYDAYHLTLISNSIHWNAQFRYNGRSVRPVRKKEVYAELAEETGTMTYYYDYDRTSRSGQTVVYDQVNRVYRPTYYFRDKVLKAVVDPSMKEAKMTSMSYMFDRCEMMTSIEGLENLNTTEVTDMQFMFWNCSKLESLDLSSFNTSNVERMSDMFWDCRSLRIIDLSSFDITNVSDMSYMFHSCSELTTICCFDDWSTSNAGSYIMFQGCDKLVGGKGTPYNDAFMDKTYARPDGGTGSPGYFTADTMTGIKAIDNGQRTTDDRFYKQGSTIVNLAGQRISKIQKGIYIVNGKKVAVK